MKRVIVPKISKFVNFKWFYNMKGHMQILITWGKDKLLLNQGAVLLLFSVLNKARTWDHRLYCKNITFKELQVWFI